MGIQQNVLIIINQKVLYLSVSSLLDTIHGVTIVPGCHILPNAGSPGKAPWLPGPTGSRPGMSWPLGRMLGCSGPVVSFCAIHACARAAQSTWPAHRQKVLLVYCAKKPCRGSDLLQKNILMVHLHRSLTWILRVLERLHPLLLAQGPLRPGLSSLVPHHSLLDLHLKCTGQLVKF